MGTTVKKAEVILVLVITNAHYRLRVEVIVARCKYEPHKDEDESPLLVEVEDQVHC